MVMHNPSSVITYDDTGMRKGPVITKEDLEDIQQVVMIAADLGNDLELKEDSSLLQDFAVAFQND